MSRFTFLRRDWALLAAVLLLAAGLVIDISITRPRLDRVRSLHNERQTLLAQISQSRGVVNERRVLAERLQRQDLDELVVPSVEPLSYLGQTVDDSGVQQLELRALETVEDPLLRRTRLSLLVSGRFDTISDLIHSLESGQRLATIDALTIRRVPGSRDLESRLNVSIYDPLREGTS